jgi:hypothetical protein
LGSRECLRQSGSAVATRIAMRPKERLRLKRRQHGRPNRKRHRKRENSAHGKPENFKHGKRENSVKLKSGKKNESARRRRRRRSQRPSPNLPAESSPGLRQSATRKTAKSAVYSLPLRSLRNMAFPPAQIRSLLQKRTRTATSRSSTKRRSRAVWTVSVPDAAPGKRRQGSVFQAKSLAAACGVPVFVGDASPATPPNSVCLCRLSAPLGPHIR